MSRVAVIGLGMFGVAVARHLHTLGQEVLAVDLQLERVEEIADFVDAAICADATDEKALVGLEPHRFDTIVVAMGAHAVEASILTTTILRQVGASHIVARAADQLHARVLRAVGAHEVIDPESEMGKRLAEKLTYPNVIDELELGDATVAELFAPPAMLGLTLAELQIRNRYNATVLAIRRGEHVQTNPGSDERIREGDILVVLGHQNNIRNMAKRG